MHGIYHVRGDMIEQTTSETTYGHMENEQNTRMRGDARGRVRKATHSPVRQRCVYSRGSFKAWNATVDIVHHVIAYAGGVGLQKGLLRLRLG